MKQILSSFKRWYKHNFLMSEAERYLAGASTLEELEYRQKNLLNKKLIPYY